MNTMQDFLIIEDDEVFASLLTRGLTQRDFQVSHVTDIAGAEKLLHDIRFRHAIVDLKLEHETTISAIPAFLRIQPELSILMLTGYASIATAVEAIKLGAVNYLPKPSSIEDILLALNHDSDERTELPEQCDTPSVQRLEWEHIQHVLSRNNGNISQTARELNMHRRTLQRKLQKRPVKK